MNLLDLPDEILLLILQKLNVIDALVGQRGLHSRLDQLLFDPLYVRELDFTIQSWNDSNSPIDTIVLDRICEEILPHIADQITKLTLEPISIERVLRVVDYPRMSSLSLWNFTKQQLVEHLANPRQTQLINEQVTQLEIDLIVGTEDPNEQLNLLDWIFSVAKSLIDFTYHPSIPFEDQNLIVSQFPSSISASLRKLNIKINTFEECLFLFDGRFPCLSDCVIFIDKIFAPSSSSSTDSGTLFSNLKHFSLTSYVQTHIFNDWIEPFIRRMSNLEKLELFLTISKRDTFRVVDGNELEQNLLIHLSQLQAFHFSIYTFLYQLANGVVNVNAYPTNADLQRSFRSKQFGQVGSYIHQSCSDTIFKCHVYSFPYQFRLFYRLAHSFTADIFTRVRTLTMHDNVSWDSHFFEKVSRSFPWIENLMICNGTPPETSEPCPMMTFTRLVTLHFHATHLDYTRQLLLNRFTHLPRLGQLWVTYEQLIALTNNFTSDPTHFNFSRVQRLITEEHFVRPQNFSRYFPLL